jgi:hypothetical protein
LKRVLSLLLVMLIVLGCIGVIACSGEETDTSTSQDSEEDNEVAKPPEEEATTLHGEDGVTWEDMPVYSGADQIAKGAWSIPPAEGDWSKVEWHYYETNDTPGNVVQFYKSQMPDNGWQENMWMDAGGMSWSFYQKNNEQDGAMIWIATDDGTTIIALMRATQ